MFIALLEDDPDQSVLLQAWLEEAGHKCSVFSSGKEITKSLIRDSYDILILDWLVPDMNGLEVLQWVRENVHWSIPVLFITQRDAEEDVVQALQYGADDYMPKPVKKAEMLARIQSISRRSQSSSMQEDVLEFTPYKIIRSTSSISLHDEAIEVTQKEFELILFMFKNSGKILSRGYILESVWGQSADLNTRTVDTHISKLRRKLAINTDNGWRLTSIYQHGYRLERNETNRSDADL
jgi:DNA-binding response OmpR family regulator